MYLLYVVNPIDLYWINTQNIYVIMKNIDLHIVLVDVYIRINCFLAAYKTV